jgi:hypothetical protein
VKPVADVGAWQCTKSRERKKVEQDRLADKAKAARFVSYAKRPMEKSKLLSKKIGINFKQKGVDFCADNRHNVNTI